MTVTDNDLKQIRIVVKEKIESSLEPVKKTLNRHSEILDEHTRRLEGIEDHLSLPTSAD